MRHLILEYLIRQLLSEEGFTSLSVRSFRGREKRLDTFIDAISNYKKEHTPKSIPLTKGGETGLVQAVKIIKKGELSGDEKDTTNLGTTYNTSSESDMNNLRTILPTLNSGDKLYLIDSSGKEHSISTIAKTAELGGKGKGYQRGADIESRQEAAMKEKLDGKVSDVVIKGETFYEIDGFRYVTGFKKADFVFTSSTKKNAYVQHKDPKHQQLSGVVRGALAGNELIQKFIDGVYDEVAANGRLKKRMILPIEDSSLQLLAMYGTANGSFSENAVQVYCIGDMQLVGDGPFELKADKIYLYPEIPEGDEIVVAATYRGGRNHKSSKGIIPDTRIGVYFKSSLGNLDEDV